MRIIHAKNYEDMSRKAANIILAQVILKPESVLGLATGSSPLGIYKRMIEWYERGDVDFSQVTTFNLDEYRGLGPDDEQSYHYFMRTKLFDKINVPAERIHIPDGMKTDALLECKEYEEMIESAGGIDLQLLGLGVNGHIGFNEPAEAFSSATHCVELTRSTIETNKRFFGSEEKVPRQACTMGIRSIMQSRRIVVAVSGENKAEAVQRALFGPVTPKVPASILQLHPDVWFIADEAALSGCRL